ncbi:MAG: MFS transporter [Parcubacteria group bacterium]|nr:MFS transporter [Parcubacteria group bacterium]
MKKNKSIFKLLTLFIINFFFAVTVALTAYSSSSFLRPYVGEEKVGLVFTVSSLLSLIVVQKFSSILKSVGRLKTFVWLLVLYGSSNVFLAFSRNGAIIIMTYVLYTILSSLLWIIIDIFIEHFSKDSNAGRIRGANLALYSLGFVVSPMISGFLIEEYGFHFVYFAASMLVIPMLMLTFFNVKNGHNFDARVKKPQKFFKIMAYIWKSDPLRHIFFIAFLLSFFYSIMVIYAPLYLTEHLHISWSTLGQMFTVMLLPFVILEYPVGYLADKYFGETEMLSLGLLIMGGSAIALFFVRDIWAITVVLFMTRVGASIVESLRDSYFYKQVNEKDVDLIDSFRNTGPLAYVIAPAIVSGMLVYLPLQWIFVFVGCITLTGLWSTLHMPDTR